METIKDILNFCTEAIFYDYENGSFTDKLSLVHRCVIDNFTNTVDPSRICIILSEIDDMILKIINKNIKDILENVYNLRNNVIYMVSFKKVAEEES